MPNALIETDGLLEVRVCRESDGFRSPSHGRRLRRASGRGSLHERWRASQKDAVEGARSSPESSETARQTGPRGPEDTVRAAWRHAEPGRNDLAPETRETSWGKQLS